MPLTHDEELFVRLAINSIEFSLKYKVCSWKDTQAEVACKLCEYAEQLVAMDYNETEMKKLISDEMSSFVGSEDRAMAIEYLIIEGVYQNIMDEAESILEVFKSMNHPELECLKKIE
jgi:hypothetical protein